MKLPDIELNKGLYEKLFDPGDSGTKKTHMPKLNPITAGYLKLLELVSVVLIALGEKLDPLFSPQQLSSEHPQRLHPHEPRWSHDDQRFDISQRPSSSDSEPIGFNLPDYYFNRYDPRSPFYDHFHDSNDW